MVDLSLKDIQNISTPFYLFDTDHLEEQICCIKRAFTKYWDNYGIAYSVKTNSLPSLCKEMATKNIMAEVVSKDEYDLVRAIGFKHDAIVCNGPVKNVDWIISLIGNHSCINIDSKSELTVLCEYASKHSSDIIKVGIRVNNDIEDVFPGASTAGVYGSRFGFSYESGELEKVIILLSSCVNIKISGLHLHVSTNLRSIEVYKYICAKFCELVNRFHLKDIEYLDVGGGFYGEIFGKPKWSDYISAISSVLKENGYSPEFLKVIIEPGVGLLSGCFSYYSRVVDVKDTTRMRFVLLDGSRLHVDPLMHKTIKNYFYDIEQAELKPKYSSAQTLVGNTCLEYDTFFTLDDCVELQLGDLIRFDKVGAYTMTFSPLFISWFPQVLKISKGKIEIARDRWTTKEILQKSNI